MKQSKIGKRPAPPNLPQESVENQPAQELDTNRIFRGLCLAVLKDPATTPSERFKAMQMYHELESRGPSPAADVVSTELAEATEERLDQELDVLVVLPLIQVALGHEDPTVNLAHWPATTEFLQGEFERRVEERARPRARWLFEREVGTEQTPEAVRDSDATDVSTGENEGASAIDPQVMPSAIPPPPGIEQWPRRKRRNRRPGIR